MPNRGEVWIANLDPPIGHEQGRTRPVLIVSTDKFNNGPATILIVVPITTTNRKVPFHVEVYPPEGGLQSVSYLLCDHVRSISKDRLKNKIGEVTDDTIKAVAQRLKILMEL
jgi:mRNA interferase MazF